MELAGIAALAAAIFAYALVSGALASTPVTLPMLFAGFGWLVGSGGLDLVPVEAGHGVIHTIAELTLILVLFADAARMDLRRLVRDHAIPVRMLALGMPLTILAGTATAMLIFPEATLATAFLVAAILAPTDAALGQSVVSDRTVPVRIRQALNAESGLNDGLALPLVLVAAALSASVHTGGSASDWALFALLQVTLGPLAGVATAFVGVRLIRACSAHGWMTGTFKGIAILSVAVLAFAIAELIGSDDFGEAVSEMAMIHIFSLSRMDHDHLFFQTNFDGDVVAYFEGFKPLEAPLREVLSHFEGAPAADAEFTDLLEFIAAGQVEVIGYFCGYPELTVNQIRRDADWRSKLIDMQKSLAQPAGKVAWGQSASGLA